MTRAALKVHYGVVTTETDRFALARRNEHQLNTRQRQVLDLLTEGRTNGEIAEAFGMTLDGAKWNVSEILGKLGLASREEAAEFWRWRRSTAGRLPALRALVGIGALKWAAASGAAFLLAVVVLAFFARPEERQEPGVPPFYLEGRFQVTDRSSQVGTNVAGADLSGIPTETTVSLLRWWHEDRDHARVEFEVIEGLDAGRVTIVVADGADQWVYHSHENTYSRTPLPPLPPEIRVRPIGTSVLLGPSWASTPGELRALLRDWAGDGGSVSDAGTEVVLGRTTTIIQMTPASRGSQLVTLPDGSQREEDTSRGVSRIWLDEERMVVLRYIVDDPVQSVFAEITRYDHGKHPPPAKLRFDPPVGAELVPDQTGVTADADSGSVGSAVPPGERVQYVPAAGMFDAGVLPANLVPYAYTRQRTGGRVSEFVLRFAQPGGPGSLVLHQVFRAAGLPQVQQQGEARTVAGAPAWLSEKAGTQGKGTVVVLATWREGVAITITATDLSTADVIAFAEGLVYVK